MNLLKGIIYTHCIIIGEPESAYNWHDSLSTHCTISTVYAHALYIQRPPCRAWLSDSHGTRDRRGSESAEDRERRLALDKARKWRRLASESEEE